MKELNTELQDLNSQPPQDQKVSFVPNEDNKILKPDRVDAVIKARKMLIEANPNWATERRSELAGDQDSTESLSPAERWAKECDLAHFSFHKSDDERLAFAKKKHQIYIEGPGEEVEVVMDLPADPESKSNDDDNDAMDMSDPNMESPSTAGFGGTGFQAEMGQWSA